MDYEALIARVQGAIERATALFEEERSLEARLEYTVALAICDFAEPNGDEFARRSAAWMRLGTLQGLAHVEFSFSNFSLALGYIEQCREGQFYPYFPANLKAGLYGLEGEIYREMGLLDLAQTFLNKEQQLVDQLAARGKSRRRASLRGAPMK